MCNDAVSSAFQKVGRFFYDFALMEQDINERIIDKQQLKGGAADEPRRFSVHRLNLFSLAYQDLNRVLRSTSPQRTP
jgi:hypothetical protein